MAATAIVRSRIDPTLKDDATRVLADMGLTVNDAIRIFLTQVVSEKALPFPVKMPNAETQAALDELNSGKGRRFNSVAELMKDLDDHGLPRIHGLS